jgi:hypothetical protein
MSDSSCCLPGSVNQTCERDNLIGDCTVRTQPFAIQAGTYLKGEILFKTGIDAELANLTTDPGLTDDNAVGIMPFDVVISDRVDEMAVYVGGEFNEDVVTGYTDLSVLKLTLTGDIRLRKFY